MEGMQQLAGHATTAAERFLGQKEDFENGSKAAQIFSGSLFSALVVYLIFSNSTRLSYIQRASLEKRLTVCCQINTCVAALSAFLNFFQLTEVDNWALPDQRQFTVDISRPIEWILTCPLMQLCLVLMGGSRIPEYRRVVMPALAAIVLLFGSATLFVNPPATYVLWSCGVVVHCFAMGLNRQQIVENSRGVEGLLTGDSEFRKATLILMATWLPFPIWYILSPEGVGYVTSVVLIQMGWAFLNICSKFTLAFYIQRIKDNYCNRLKVKREMKGGERSIDDDEEGFMEIYGSNTKARDEQGVRKVNGELCACVVETMNFLGMAENIERFLKLLKKANIFTLEDIAHLSKAQCDELQLPHDLVAAVQKRTKIWNVEMQDEAEKGLERSEKHYSLGQAQGKNRRASFGSDNAGGVSTSPVNATSPPVVYPASLQSLGDAPVAYPANAFAAQDPGQALSNPLPPPDFKPAWGYANTQEQQHPNTLGVVSANNGLAKPERPDSANGFSAGIAGIDIGFSRQSTVSNVDRKLEELENRLSEKIEYAMQMFGAKLDSGMQEVGKSMERSQALLEAKVEYVFASKNKELEAKTEQTFKRAAATTEASGSLLDNVTAKLEQMYVMMQDVKASANSLQTRMGMMEEAQNKKQMEFEERIQSHVDASTEELRGAIVQHVDSRQSPKTMLASGNEEDLIQMLRTLIPSIEVRIDIFGNSMRSQLETMQTAQMQQRMESDRALAAKLDGMGAKGVQLCIEDLKGNVEEAARSSQEKANDMHEMLASVLEHAKGAKDRCAECSNKIEHLNEKLKFLK